MSTPTPSRSSTRNRGNVGNKNVAKGKTLLLAAVCASLTPSTSAFTVGPIRGPAHVDRTSSPPQNGSALLSSPNENNVYFFTAPPQPGDDDKSKAEQETKSKVKTIAKATEDIVSAEQTELESMDVSNDEEEEEEEDLLSTRSVAKFALSQAAAPSPASTMDVDGNGTGALMKRSPAAGGVHAPLMATNPSLAFPIDSGKEGMQAKDTRERTRKSLHNGIINRAEPQTRLVRYSLPPSKEEIKQGNSRKSLVLAPATMKNGMNGELAPPRPQSPNPLQPSKPRLVRYNGPDVENSTDHDGMELRSVSKNRNRELKLQRANLVRYNGASQQKRLTEEVPLNKNSDGDEIGTEEDHQKGRKTLVEDLEYANRYTGLSDFNLARKTGLMVNKPISLWVERDKFL